MDREWRESHRGPEKWAMALGRPVRLLPIHITPSCNRRGHCSTGRDQGGLIWAFAQELHTTRF